MLYSWLPILSDALECRREYYYYIVIHGKTTWTRIQDSSPSLARRRDISGFLSLVTTDLFLINYFKSAFFLIIFFSFSLLGPEKSGKSTLLKGLENHYTVQAKSANYLMCNSNLHFFDVPIALVMEKKMQIRERATFSASSVLVSW